MYIKIDKDGNLTEVVENFKAGCLEDNYEVDTDKLLFAKYVDGKIIYDDKSYKKHVKNHRQVEINRDSSKRGRIFSRTLFPHLVNHQFS